MRRNRSVSPRGASPHPPNLMLRLLGGVVLACAIISLLQFSSLMSSSSSTVTVVNGATSLRETADTTTPPLEEQLARRAEEYDDAEKIEMEETEEERKKKQREEEMMKKQQEEEERRMKQQEEERRKKQQEEEKEKRKQKEEEEEKKKKQKEKEEEEKKKTKKPAVRIPEPPVAVVPGSKGIVMALHNGIIPLGASLVRELRCLGNQERIEVYHCDELSEENRELLRIVDDNLEIINVCESLVSRHVLTHLQSRDFHNYWIKPLAIHQTTLEQPLLIDADAILLKDPSLLRDLPGYRDHGTMFFYDRVIRDANYFNSWYEPGDGAPKVHYLPYWLEHFDYARFNLTADGAPSERVQKSWAFRDQTCHEQDSSLLLLDKSRPGATAAMSVLWFLATEERHNRLFSHGDKEAFWLAYEFAHAPYFFSPWGASVVASHPNGDVERYRGTLCGSLAHYLPVDDGSPPELLYINGRAAIDPVPFNLDQLKELRRNLVFNLNPSHMVPRQVRAPGKPHKEKSGDSFHMECIVGQGKTPTPPELRNHLWRRRMHFLAVSMQLLEPLQSCELGGSLPSAVTKA